MDKLKAKDKPMDQAKVGGDKSKDKGKEKPSDDKSKDAEKSIDQDKHKVKGKAGGDKPKDKEKPKDKDKAGGGKSQDKNKPDGKSPGRSVSKGPSLRPSKSRKIIAGEAVPTGSKLLESAEERQMRVKAVASVRNSRILAIRKDQKKLAEEKAMEETYVIPLREQQNQGTVLTADQARVLSAGEDAIKKLDEEAEALERQRVEEVERELWRQKIKEARQRQDVRDELARIKAAEEAEKQRIKDAAKIEKRRLKAEAKAFRKKERKKEKRELILAKQRRPFVYEYLSEAIIEREGKACEMRTKKMQQKARKKVKREKPKLEKKLYAFSHAMMRSAIEDLKQETCLKMLPYTKIRLRDMAITRLTNLHVCSFMRPIQLVCLFGRHLGRWPIRIRKFYHWHLGKIDFVMRLDLYDSWPGVAFFVTSFLMTIWFLFLFPWGLEYGLNYDESQMTERQKTAEFQKRIIMHRYGTDYFTAVCAVTQGMIMSVLMYNRMDAVFELYHEWKKQIIEMNVILSYPIGDELVKHFFVFTVTGFIYIVLFIFPVGTVRSGLTSIGYAVVKTFNPYIFTDNYLTSNADGLGVHYSGWVQFLGAVILLPSLAWNKPYPYIVGVMLKMQEDLVMRWKARLYVCLEDPRRLPSRFERVSYKFVLIDHIKVINLGKSLDEVFGRVIEFLLMFITVPMVTEFYFLYRVTFFAWDHDDEFYFRRGHDWIRAGIIFLNSLMSLHYMSAVRNIGIEQFRGLDVFRVHPIKSVGGRRTEVNFLLSLYYSYWSPLPLDIEGEKFGLFNRPFFLGLYATWFMFAGAMQQFDMKLDFTGVRFPNMETFLNRSQVSYFLRALEPSLHNTHPLLCKDTYHDEYDPLPHLYRYRGTAYEYCTYILESQGYQGLRDLSHVGPRLYNQRHYFFNFDDYPDTGVMKDYPDFESPEYYDGPEPDISDY